MAASAGSIRMAKAHVEIGGDTGPLRKALDGAKSNMQSWGAGLMGIGSGLLSTGMMMAGALIPAIVQFANYEQALADLKAAAGPGLTGRFGDVKDKIEEIAKATGMGPVEVTQAFSELLKAGKSVDEVLGGLGETTVKFARVSGMSTAETAVILSDALNVFGGSADRAANIMNQAADASTISLRDVSESFAAGGSVMAQFNQSMLDTATAIGIMGNAGIKGAVAGTALKTLMTRLATGVGEAGEEAGATGAAMTEMGLNIYGATGQIIPFAQILERIETGLVGRSEQDRNRLLTGLAGMRGILGLAPLLAAGTAGFAAFQTTMATALTVEQKFAIMTDTVWEALKKVWVHIQFVAIAIGAALAPALRGTGALLLPFLNGLQTFIQANESLVQALAFDAVKAIAFGAALIGLGLIFSFLGSIIGGVSVVVGVLSSAFGFIFGPIALPILAIAAAALLVWYNFDAIYAAVVNLWTAFAASPLGAFVATVFRIWLGFALVMAVIYIFVGYVAYLAASELFTLWIEGVQLLWSALVAVFDLWVQGMGMLFGWMAPLFNFFAAIGDQLVTALSTAFTRTMDGFTELFGRIFATALQAWAGIREAFAAGDWEVIWGIVKFSALTMWNDLSYFLTSTFYVWKDTLIDVFSSVWLSMKIGFALAWGAVKATAFQVLASIARGMALLAIGPARDLLLAQAAGFGLDAQIATTQAQVQVAAMQAQAVEDQAPEAFLRELRDALLAQGRTDEAAQLQQQMNDVTELLWLRNLNDTDQSDAAELVAQRNAARAAGRAADAAFFQNQLNMLYDDAQDRDFRAFFDGIDAAATAAAPATPDGGAAMAAATFGSFSGGQISGYGMGVSPAERTARAVERAVEIEQAALAAAQRAAQLLADIAANAGLMVAL